MTQKVKVVSAKSSRVRVWNLSDSEKYSERPASYALFGKNVSPGKSVMVSAEEYEAVKTKLHEIKGLVVGDTPPEAYLVEKGRVQAKAPKGATRSHGPKAPKKADAPKAPSLTPPPKVEAPAEPSESELEELTKPEETRKTRGSRRSR